MLSKLKGEHDRTEERLDSARGELRRIKQEIARNAKYLTVQEEQVNEAIAAWNGRLTEMHAEAERLNEDKAAIASAVVRLQQQFQTLDSAVEQKQLELQQLKDIYEQKLQLYRSDLRAQLS